MKGLALICFVVVFLSSFKAQLCVYFNIHSIIFFSFRKEMERHLVFIYSDTTNRSQGANLHSVFCNRLPVCRWSDSEPLFGFHFEV